MAYAADSTSFNPTAVSVKAAPGGGAVPVGAIVAWPVATNPPDAANWLECIGQSTSGYPELAAVIGGAVPDLRGKFLRGLGGNSAALGTTQEDTIRNITGNVGLISGNNEYMTEAFSITSAFPTGFGSGRYPLFITRFDASRVVPTANENRPVNMAVRYLIRARP